MKAQQNRDMTYDEMNDYAIEMERHNLREVAYCHKFIYINIIHCSYEYNVLSITMFMYRLGDASPLPIEGSQLAQHASPDEAHRTVYSSSGGL